MKTKRGKKAGTKEAARGRRQGGTLENFREFVKMSGVDDEIGGEKKKKWGTKGVKREVFWGEDVGRGRVVLQRGLTLGKERQWGGKRGAGHIGGGE